MTKAGIDLGAYFERIGWGGEVRPTFEALAGMPNRRLDRMGRFSVDCREINRFYSADCPDHDPGG